MPPFPTTATQSYPKSNFVVAANRLPVRWEAPQNRWLPSPGGLVSAMMNSLQDYSPLCWVGWTGVSGELYGSLEPERHDISFIPVPLSKAESELYYEGMSNATIWPLYHDCIRPPEFHRTWWNSYIEVNQRFCDTIDAVAAPGAIVWIHDYHLQLVPQMLRERRPDVRIGFFLHIPFPPADLFMRLPFRRQLMEGLLGADVVGTQTTRSRDNFRRTAVSLGVAEADGLEQVRVVDGVGVGNGRDGKRDRQTDGSDASSTSTRAVAVRRFSIGIDVERFKTAAASPQVRARAQEIRDMVGVKKIILGVDRLDYTKGIDVRFKAFGELMTEGLLSARDHSMLQVAEPSRSNVNQYVELREEVEQLVGKINGLHGQLGRPAIHYFHQSQPFEEIVALYLAADVLLVTPLRDGMNLVAKEFVATRLDNTGTMVLSEFAGAAELLHQAILVNPYDTDGIKKAILDAVSMPAADAAAAMTAMRESVEANDVHGWVRNFVDCLG